MSEPGAGKDRREGEEAEGSFRVIDRRRFAPDGSERAPSDEATPETQPQAGSRDPAPEPPRARETHTAAADQRTAEEAYPNLGMPTGEPYGDERSGAAEPSFSTLLISLSTQALMYLGEIPDLEGGEAKKDLPAARNIIDLLGVLQQKTAGNLDANESALLERILYDLRMRFVELSRS
jgi:hypothetical protein